MYLSFLVGMYMNNCTVEDERTRLNHCRHEWGEWRLKTWLLSTNTSTCAHNQQTVWVLNARLRLYQVP
jgi:hypothetical protein